ncbi:hypothetical protein [Caldanaerobacter sp.]|uniref:hypothetical protein n=1 Tax=Caldanaerobacter sp. TaxID=2930036 RepID=UPI003C74BC08
MSLEILDKPLMKALLDGTIPFHEVMYAYDIRLHIIFSLPSSVLGFTYISGKGNYYILLNGNVNYRTQVKVFLHEIHHILDDVPKTSYFIGLNMEYIEIEKHADMVAEEIIEYLAASQ